MFIREGDSFPIGVGHFRSIDRRVQWGCRQTRRSVKTDRWVMYGDAVIDKTVYHQGHDVGNIDTVVGEDIGLVTPHVPVLNQFSRMSESERADEEVQVLQETTLTLSSSTAFLWTNTPFVPNPPQIGLGICGTPLLHFENKRNPKCPMEQRGNLWILFMDRSRRLLRPHVVCI